MSSNLNSPTPDFLRMAIERGTLPAQAVYAGGIVDGDQAVQSR
jgi:hypothetical protein